MLDTTEVSVNRALHRARLAIEHAGDDRERAPLPGSPEERDLVARFTTAFEAGDIPGVVELLTDDGTLRMPPEGIEYQGRAAIAEFLATIPGGGRLERFRLIPTPPNGACSAA